MRFRWHLRLWLILLYFVIPSLSDSWEPSRSAWAAPPRVLPVGKVPADRRLQPLKDLNGYFPFVPASSVEQWNVRAERVRRRLKVALGLWPLPTKTPLRPVVHGKMEMGDYTVERVYFESIPGLYVTGNLFRPARHRGKAPGVLCPHGHWRSRSDSRLTGRFYEASPDEIASQLKQNAEVFESAAANPLQARCVQLARMGCVVFFYDMLGYGDSHQISFELAHRFAKQRPDMNTDSEWGLFSPQAESNSQCVMGLQTWNSIRSIDFLQSLPDVDPERIGVTGASGGGTQTMILCGIDPRPTVSMPCVMVSTAMQGGCTCENCCHLRVDTGNVEFAALFAPKPQGLTAADDWTRELAQKGFPELQQHYQQLGHPDNVLLLNRTDFKHNYNAISRAAMYRWFNQHLELKLTEAQLKERDFDRLTIDELTVWDESDHPRPASGPNLERELLQWWHQDSQRQMREIRSSRSLGELRRVVGGAVDVLIGRRLPAAEDVELEQIGKEDRGEYLWISGLLRNKPVAEEIPVVFLYPKRWEGTAVIWADPDGTQGMFQDDGTLRPEIDRLVSAGASVVGADLFQQGEFRPDGAPLERTRAAPFPEREFAGYTFGYNHTLFAQRVHDILSLIIYVRSHAYQPERVCIAGFGDAGAWVAAARAQAPGAVDRAAVETAGFRFANVRDIHDPRFLPGGATFFDLPGMLALSAPDALWLAGETVEGNEFVRSVYMVAQAADRLTIDTAGPESQKRSAVRWLLQQE